VSPWPTIHTGNFSLGSFQRRATQNLILAQVMSTSSGRHSRMAGQTASAAGFTRVGVTACRSSSHARREENALEHGISRRGSEFRRGSRANRKSVEKIEKWRLGPTHRDFSPDHLLVDGRTSRTGLRRVLPVRPVFDVAILSLTSGISGYFNSALCIASIPWLSASRPRINLCRIQSLVRLNRILHWRI